MKKTSIGGMALLEGLMMIGPKSIAIAVRKPDGDIVVDKRELPSKNFVNKIPILRGIKAFVRQMVVGIKALMYSAEFFDLEEEEVTKTKFDLFLERVFGDKLKDVAIYVGVVISIAFSVGAFILLPNLIVSLLPFASKESGMVVFRNLIEGVVRISLFLTYLILVSKMKDIKRVWQYHGAEHKTIHAYENGDELTIENVMKYTTKHPRCGTSFLFIVIIISVITFSFVGWHGILINALARIILIPFVAGISYEILKFAGRCESKYIKILNAPGLFFQTFTTKEPDQEMVEVAIAALDSVLVKDDTEADKW